MKSHYRVVVIGGGVVGASVLYHLAKLGWTDIALIERKELTAGSTWHAAAGFHAINADPNIAALQGYTINLYKQLEEESGQSIGLHMTGGVNMAGTPERWEWLKSAGRDLQDHGHRRCPAGDAGRDQGAVPDLRRVGALWRALRCGRGLSRPLRHHPSLCRGGAEARRRADPAQPRAGAARPRRRLLGRGDRAGHRSAPSTWSMPAACGPSRSG